MRELEGRGGKRINGDLVVALQLKKEWAGWGKVQNDQEWLMEEISESWGLGGKGDIVESPVMG